MFRASLLVAALAVMSCGDDAPVFITDAGPRGTETADTVERDARTNTSAETDASTILDGDVSIQAATDGSSLALDASDRAAEPDATRDVFDASIDTDADAEAKDAEGELDASDAASTSEEPDAEPTVDASADSDVDDAEVVDAESVDADTCVASGAPCVDPSFAQSCLVGHELCIGGVVTCAAQTPWLTFPGNTVPVPAYPSDGQSCAGGGTCTNGACVPPPFDPTACGGPGLHCRANERCYLDKTPAMCCTGTGDSCNVYSCGGAFPGCQDLSTGGMGCCRQNDAH